MVFLFVGMVEYHRGMGILEHLKIVWEKFLRGEFLDWFGEVIGWNICRGVVYGFRESVVY